MTGETDDSNTPNIPVGTTEVGSRVSVSPVDSDWPSSSELNFNLDQIDSPMNSSLKLLLTNCDQQMVVHHLENNDVLSVE